VSDPLGLYLLLFKLWSVDMYKKLIGVVVALSGTPLLASAALAAPACVTGSVASYVALGAGGCSVGSVTFSSISVGTTVSGSGSVTLGNITPFTTGGEFGLSLNYSANTGSTPGSAADVAWIYNVASVPNLTDAFLSYGGNVTGTGTATVSEVLSNGVTLALNAPGSITQTFTPIASLGVIKDQNDFSGSAGSATTSILQNAFSAVPAPLAGAGLPGLVAACGGLLALARRRRQKQVVA
jgi:hypothetical protein